MLNWKIEQAERDPVTGFVKVVHYSIAMIDENLKAEAQGSIKFQGDPSQDGFIPYDQLTQEEVLNWVQTYLGPQKILSIEQKFLKQFEQYKNPNVENGLPWKSE